MKVAWWNTSLAPVAVSGRATEATKVVAAGVIGELLQSFDLIGLCELSESEIQWLQLECADKGFTVISGVGTLNRSITDTCVIARDSMLKAGNSVSIRKYIEGRGQKIAQRVEFVHADGTFFVIFVSHWPSLLTYNKGTSQRDDYGYALRSLVDEILDADENARVILMGDYNDEPFDRPMADKLRASRDRHRVLHSERVLYNPFWHRIGSDRNYLRDQHSIGFCGTHFFAADKVDRWRTFDQIIVSKGLLSPQDWHLDESSVQVIDIPAYSALVLNPDEKFDHFPVGIALKRT
jgi:hypothetical protein